jgi:hypothetical protein
VAIAGIRDTWVERDGRKRARRRDRRAGNRRGGAAARRRGRGPVAGDPVRLAPRGAADARSDLDFLGIESEVADRHRELVRLRDALAGRLVPADVLVFSEREVEDWREVPNIVIHTALREGRVLRG